MGRTYHARAVISGFKVDRLDGIRDAFSNGEEWTATPWKRRNRATLDGPLFLSGGAPEITALKGLVYRANTANGAAMNVDIRLWLADIGSVPKRTRSSNEAHFTIENAPFRESAWPIQRSLGDFMRSGTATCAFCSETTGLSPVGGLFAIGLSCRAALSGLINTGPAVGVMETDGNPPAIWPGALRPELVRCAVCGRGGDAAAVITSGEPWVSVEDWDRTRLGDGGIPMRSVTICREDLAALPS